MKSKIAFLIILTLTIFGLAIYGYLKAVPGVENEREDLPQIKITPTTFNFGEIEYGKVVEYTFKVKNSGDKILEIKKIATSCACTTAEIAKNEILPGEETELRVVYNTGAMSGAHAKGKQERIIYIRSNDPINPQMEIMIYAYVK